MGARKKVIKYYLLLRRVVPQAARPERWFQMAGMLHRVAGGMRRDTSGGGGSPGHRCGTVN